MICHLHYGSQPCPDCAIAAFLTAAGVSARRSVAPAVITFKPLVIEHMFDPWEKPRAFDTPQELMRETHKRGVESQYLRDSLLWRSKPPKEW